MRKLAPSLALVAIPLAVVFAPDLNPYGAAFALVAVALLCLPGLMAGGLPKTRWVVLVPALLAGGYFALRAGTSPVADLGLRDGFILAGGMLGLLVGLQAPDRTAKFLAVGAMAIGVVSALVAGWQEWDNPLMKLFYGVRPTTTHPSGLSGHYNHFANFVGAAGVLALALSFGAGKRLIRIIAAVAALLMLAGVVLSQSRGGVVAAGAGVLVVVGAHLFWGWEKPKVIPRVIAVVGGVLAMTAVIAFGGKLAKTILHERITQGGSLDASDNGRLEFLQIAQQVAELRPLTGSGSRAFSYEAFQFWNPEDLWVRSGDIDMVHNEAVQVLTDYGLIGIGLLVALLLAVCIVALSASATEMGKPWCAWRYGACGAALVMIIQSQFSFVFHILPDTMLFGLLLGLASRRFDPTPKTSPVWAPGRLTGAAVCVAAIAIAGRHSIGWWHLHGTGSSDGDGLARLEKVAKVAPDYSIWFQVASEEVRLANEPGTGPSRGIPLLEGAVSSLTQVLERHPWHYISCVSRARMLDQLDRFAEAEEDYCRVIPLLDPREYYYKSRFYLAQHYMRLAEQRWMRTGHASGMDRDASQVLAYYDEALFQMEKSQKLAFSQEKKELIGALSKRIDFLQGARVEPAAITRLGGEVETP